MKTKEELTARLKQFRQTSALQFWDELDDAGKKQLLQQVESIDLPQLTQLIEGGAQEHDWAAEARAAVQPTALRLSDRIENDSASQGPFGWSVDQAREAGCEALKAGKVGVILVAGGQGSRLGFDKPKGLYPIGPFSGASLLQIHFEKVLAASRKYDATIPIYFMNSPATQDEQNAYLAQQQFFGISDLDVFQFCQGTMPASDARTGELLLSEKGKLFLSPDGHGGTIAALSNSGALDDMRRRGVELLFYWQVDNPLVPVCDAEFIGHHLLARSEMTSIAVTKQDPQDKVGNFVSIDGRVHVIEYSDFPEDVAKQREEDGSLKFWAGSIAIHLFDVAFLQRSLKLKDSLPFHVAHKKVPHLDRSGKLVEPAEPNALKFERFIFDLLPHAKNAIVVEYAEEDCFAPLKNAPGAAKDTEDYVQQFMIDQYHRWLQAAGAKIADGVHVEISPLWALEAADVAALVEPGMKIDKPVYLQ